MASVDVMLEFEYRVKIWLPSSVRSICVLESIFEIISIDRNRQEFHTTPLADSIISNVSLQ